jgi:hypothetical protein
MTAAMVVGWCVHLANPTLAAQLFRRNRRNNSAAAPAQTANPPIDRKKVAEMSQKSYHGELPKLSERETALAAELKTHVTKLAGEIGERNTRHYAKLAEAAAYIERTLTDSGYKVARQTFEVRGQACFNLEVELPGDMKKDEIVVVGAHYDSALGAPGANDNGSGIAGVLCLAKALAGKQKTAGAADRTIRFVAFTNEEMPYFQTEAMGSLVYARRCQARKENIAAMLCLETIGYYSDASNSQKYPAPLAALYPSTGNFIGFVGDLASANLVNRVTESFRAHARFPSEAAALPSVLDGVGWSDHWSFWQCGYRAVMATDTAPFRYPYYHTAQDTPDKNNYERMARVIAGIEGVIGDLAKVADSKASEPKPSPK